MTSTDILLYLILNLFRVYIIFRFLRTFLSVRNLHFFVHFSFFVLFYASNSICFLVWKNAWGSLLVSIGGIFMLACVDFKESLKLKLLTTALIFALSLALEDTIWALLTYVIPVKNIVVFGNFLCLFSLLIVELLLEKFRSRRQEIPIPLQTTLILLLIPLCSIFITAALIEEVSDGYHWIQILGLGLIVLSDMFLFSLYEKTVTIHEKEIQNQFLQSQLAHYTRQFSLMQESQQKIQALRHDMRHHVQLITTYAQQKDCDAVLSYIEQLSSHLQTPKEHVSTGNQEIDSILNFFIDRAVALQTSVTTELAIPQQLAISAFDLNILLSNLLSNALEALAKIEKKKLQITISVKAQVLYISIGNTCQPLTTPANASLPTTKPNKNEHGIGLRNVQQIVDRYQGMIQFDYEGNWFQTDLILYLSKS